MSGGAKMKQDKKAIRFRPLSHVRYHRRRAAAQRRRGADIHGVGWEDGMGGVAWKQGREEDGRTNSAHA